MDNAEVLRQLDKEITISYIIIIQAIINWIIIYFVKKNILNKDTYEHKTIRNAIWHFSALSMFFYASLIYKQSLSVELTTIIAFIGIILYTAYKFSKIDKKFGSLILILSLNLVVILLFIRYIYRM